MKIKFSKNKDIFAGLVFFFCGVLSVYLARNYPMGTAARMGPGYFPSILGGVLAILGIIISVRSLWTISETIRPIRLRPLALVIGAVVGFALLVKPLGLILATFVLVFFSCLGGWQFRLREVVLLSIVLILISVTFFIFGLGLPFNIWPA
jgi:hypothetical protein